jgi:hypothetical protein
MRKDGAGFNLSFIEPDFTSPHMQEFDAEYMRRLFDYAYALGSKGCSWKEVPPGYSAPIGQ